MTDDGLADIRARDAADDLYRLTSGNLSTEAEKVAALMGAIMDRRALLAEVDRLHALTDHPEPFALHWMGVERVRIHNAMLGLDWTGCGGWGCAENMSDLYQTVLTVIDEGAR